MASDRVTIAVDNGAYTVKVGTDPSLSEPSAVYKPVVYTLGDGGGDVCIGELPEGTDSTAWSCTNAFDSSGAVCDWDAMAAVWRKVFTDAGVKIDGDGDGGGESDGDGGGDNSSKRESLVVIGYNPVPGAFDAQRAGEILFERFGIDRVVLAPSQLLSLITSGRTTGVVVDVGHTGSTAVTVVDGVVIPQSIQRSSVGSAAVSARVAEGLRTANTAPAVAAGAADVGDSSTTGTTTDVQANDDDNNDTPTNTSSNNNTTTNTSSDGSTISDDVVRAVKEAVCRVAVDYNEELKSIIAASNVEKCYSYTPDPPTTVVPPGLRLSAAEILFDSAVNTGPLHRLAYRSALECEGAIETKVAVEALKSLVVAGAGSRHECLASRLQKEMTAALSEYTEYYTKVVAPPDRGVSAWVGAAILIGLDVTVTDLAVTAAEFAEGGAAVFAAKWEQATF